METISLDQEPSCVFSATRDSTAYVISLRTFADMTFATVKVNGTTVASSVRCVPDSWIIPYTHLMADGGNFRFECSDEHYPIYSNYGVSAFLRYYTPDEYAAIIEAEKVQ